MDSFGTVEAEISKLRYQITLLANALDRKEYPVESMVLELNWSQEDLEAAEEIFEKWDESVLNGGGVDLLEQELRDRFRIGYQTVKTIILAFWRAEQFTNVCEAYAKVHDVAEFKVIKRAVESRETA